MLPGGLGRFVAAGTALLALLQNQVGIAGDTIKAAPRVTYGDKAKVHAAAVFPMSFAPLDRAEDYKLIFEPITPPNNPATIRAGQTPFSDNAIQMRRVTLEPCGVIAAHVHPRGTEWGYVIDGAIEFGMFLESGQRLDVTYEAGEGVVVPQGTVHFARNTVCKKSEIVVIFDHPNPAVMYVGAALSAFPQDYLTSAFDTGYDAFPTANPNQFFAKECACNVDGDGSYGDAEEYER